MSTVETNSQKLVKQNTNGLPQNGKKLTSESNQQLQQVRGIKNPVFPKTQAIYSINHADHKPLTEKLIPLGEMFKAYKSLKAYISRTPLTKATKLSEKFQANIYLKREDLQVVRSFKLRGAFYKFIILNDEQKKKGVVCSSAGNHAQGVAYACNFFKVKGTIFMPIDAPDIKVRAVKMFGGQYVSIQQTGDTFDQALAAARKFEKENGATFVHAYDDELVVAGQGTAAIEALEDFEGKIDYFFVPIGGGGLSGGMAAYLAQMSPHTTIIGCEPQGCPSMLRAIYTGDVKPITGINTFIDGAAVGTPGFIPHRILSETLKDIVLVPEGVCCTSLMEMYSREGIVCEPAGALCVAALEYYKDQIKGKNIVCMVSGSNNDLTRMTDIKVLSEIEQGIRFYLLVNFSQKSGSLKEFIRDVLTEDVELLSIEYTKKYSTSNGQSLIGLQTHNAKDMDVVTKELTKRGVKYRFVTPGDDLFKFLL